MNKIIVSVILAIILVLGINKIADVIFYVEKPEKSAYQVNGVTTVASTTTTETNSVESDSENIMALFASTNADDGAKIFKKCAACHSIAQGGGNKIGPALWGVLGRKAGSISDYKYSKAMLAHHSLKQFLTVQNLETLWHYLLRQIQLKEQKFLRNVLLAIASVKVAAIKSGRRYGVFLEEKLVLSPIINIQKQ